MAHQPVHKGQAKSKTVDGTECGYLLRVFFQARPLLWEVGLVGVTYSGATGRAVMMPWVEEEQEPFAQG